jgi:hypothetical protein
MSLPASLGVEPQTHDVHDARKARRAIGFGVTMTLVLAVAGLAGIPRARQPEFEAYSLFFTQFARIEMLPLVYAVAFALGLYLWMRVTRPDAADESTPTSEPAFQPWIVALIACSVTLIAYAGVRWLFRGYIMSDDEYSGWFQAQVFAHGKTHAVIPPAWCPYGPAITPTSVYFRQDCTWKLTYLPIHSLVQAFFIALRIPRLGVPIEAGLSVLLVASIARKIWPDQPSRAYWSALFMATSTQFLVMSMTVYAMVTHLLLTLVFLRVYLEKGSKLELAVPWVGAVALAVHSPIPHLMLAPPFIVRYLRDRRYAFFTYTVAVYVGALAAWSTYYARNVALAEPVRAVTPATATVVLDSGTRAANGARATAPGAATAVSGTARSLVSLLALPDVLSGYRTSLHLALIPSWSNALIVILVVAAMMRWRLLPVFLRDAALAVLLTLVLRALSGQMQGEGWGYRFVYSLLGMLALLATAGVSTLSEALGRKSARIVLALAAAGAMLFQLPIRWRGVESIVGPYRDGFAWMSSLPYDAVLYPASAVAWGRQLVQNDPFGKPPMIVDVGQLGPGQLDSLMHGKAGIRAVTLSRPELHRHGLPRGLLLFGGLIIER